MRTIKLTVIAILLGFSTAYADVVQVPDFRVDQDPTSNKVSDVASSITYGYFVVTYRYTANNYTLMARRFDLNGNPLGNAFKINSTPSTASTGGWGAGVTIDTNGNMIFAWPDNRSGTYRVYFRRFDFSENPLNSDAIVDQDTAATGKEIASLPGGGFVVSYNGGRSLGGAVWARIYDSSGNPVGNDFRVDQNPDVNNSYGSSSTPVVAASAGRIYFAWVDTRDGGDPTFWANIYGRVFDSAGNPIGNDFRVDQMPWDAGCFLDSAIAAAPNGNFIVVWHDIREGGDCLLWEHDVFARAFDSNGNPLGNDFKVNDGDTGLYPDIAFSPSGRAVVSGFGLRHLTSDGTILDNTLNVGARFVAAVGENSYVAVYDAGNTVWANITGPESLIPTLSEYMTALLGLALLFSMALVLRRRSQNADRR